ncbi:MAG: hypothetical protein IT210_04775 [Armatimonadetes bacterium]|nr:hypothetical protein [Armatimonadota bacterium]
MNSHRRDLMKAIASLLCAAFLAPLAHARVGSIKLGITTNCPYGLAG